MSQQQIRTKSQCCCILCGSKGTTLHRELVDVLYNVSGKWHMSQCINRDCGLCWLDPLPIESDLPLLYKSYYTHEASSGHARSPERIQSFFRCCYLIMTYLPGLVIGLPKVRRQFREMFLNDVPQGRLLDVGCGSGDFMNWMHKLGWSVAGLDLDAQAVERAKIRYGFEPLNCNLKEANFAENYFDAITLNHVIEHIQDPVGLLSEAMRILKPGGILVAITPNARSLGHDKFQDSWRGLEPPRHLQVFTPQALRACAEQASLKVSDVFSSAVNADVITVGSLKIRRAKNLAVSTETRIGVNIIHFLKGLLFQYHELFHMRKNPESGEEVVLICRK